MARGARRYHPRHARPRAPQPLTRRAAPQLAEAGKTVAVMVPDGPELRRAEERQKGTLALLGDSVQMGALSGSRLNELEQFGAMFFGKKDEAAKPLTPKADVYLVVNASTIELVELEKWTLNTMPAGATVVAFNLEVRLALPCCIRRCLRAGLRGR